MPLVVITWPAGSPPTNERNRSEDKPSTEDEGYEAPYDSARFMPGNPHDDDHNARTQHEAEAHELLQQ